LAGDIKLNLLQSIPMTMIDVANIGWGPDLFGNFETVIEICVNVTLTQSNFDARNCASTH
jgi:hypothetical protein